MNKFLHWVTPNIIKLKIKNHFNSIWEKEMEYSRQSYSQEGEDLILERIFRSKSNGFFIDVGAHHPKRLSNTYFFYKKGWRGINIDPMPGIMNLFKMERPQDINLELGISDQEGVLKYYIFDEPALNTFSAEEAKYKDGLDGFRIIQEVKIEVHRLEKILDLYLPAGQEIDFLSIDVEGLDMNVLKSNNWKKYRPGIILVEALRSSLDLILKGELNKFMENYDYFLYAKSHNTLFYLDKSSFSNLQ